PRPGPLPPWPRRSFLARADRRRRRGCAHGPPSRLPAPRWSHHRSCWSPEPRLGGGAGGDVAVTARSDAHPIAPEVVVEGLRVDAKDACDTFLVPAVTLERSKDGVPLPIVERLIGPAVGPRGVRRPSEASRVRELLARLRDRGWEGVNGEHLTVGEHRQPFDDVSQLTDVSRPGIPREAHHRVGRDVQAFPATIGVDPEEVLDQEGDVLRPFAKRGHVDLDDGDAVVEVLPEPSALNLLAE